MVTFQETHDYLVKFEAEPGDSQHLQDFFDQMRRGQFILDGLPLDVMPAELFRRDDPQLTHVFWYRLLDVEPPYFSLAFKSFDEQSLEVSDFTRLLSVVDCEIQEHGEADGQRTPVDPRELIKQIGGPIDGAVLLCQEEGDEDNEIRVIIAYHPAISEYASRALIYSAVKQGLCVGFTM